MASYADLLRGDVSLGGTPTEDDKPNKLAQLLRSVARGVPQVVTGGVDLAALPFTATGMIEPKNVFGSTDYLTNKGLLPPAQPGLVNQTAEVLSGGLMPFSPAAIKQTVAGVKSLGPKFYESVEDFMTRSGGMAHAVPNRGFQQSIRDKPIGEGFDKRFDPRVGEINRMQNMRPKIEQYNKNDAPAFYLPEHEGKPFVTSMSDRTDAGGSLLGIDDVDFKRHVDLLGGQNFMLNNPGMVWASAKNPVNQIMREAGELKAKTGQDPLYIPWRMAPTGGDFASMTGETMLAYAQAAMPKSTKKELDNMIKGHIPGWSGIDSPQSVDQFRKAPDKVRKLVKQNMDVDFRDQGGIGIGQARLAVADPRQLNAPDGGIMNVGKIFADKPIVQKSNHFAYPLGVPGEGVGRVEQNHNIVEMLPDFVRDRGIVDPKNPSANDLRALQMHPYSGIIDDKLLKNLGY